MANSKSVQQLARQLFRLSFAEGRLSPERVAGVLGYVEKAKPAQPLAVLKAYQRLVAAEVAKSQAVIEHAGTISESLVQSIGSAMTKRYGRAVVASAKPNPALIAGLRVRVGDDVYESSVAGQLTALATTV
jgi:F-type H+-transporting ATPase subunit delta